MTIQGRQPHIPAADIYRLSVEEFLSNQWHRGSLKTNGAGMMEWEVVGLNETFNRKNK